MYKHTKPILVTNLLLSFFEGAIVFWQYIRNKSEPQSAVLWDYSVLRLALIFVIGLVLIVLFCALVQILTNQKRTHEMDKALDIIIDRAWVFWIFLVLINLAYLALFMSDHQLSSLASYRETLRPLLIWIGLVSSQFFTSYIFLRGKKSSMLLEYRKFLIPSAVVFVLIFILVGFIAVTRIGLDKDIVYWQDAGTPILFHQAVISIIVAGLLLVWKPGNWIFKNRGADLILCFVFWLLAAALWSNQPLRPSYNSLVPAPPNYQNYPFGDSLRHDLTAQEYLIGRPIPADFFVKPLYAFLLVLFHLIAGDDYSQIVFLQVLLLAWIPSMVYLLTRELSTPLAGVVAALLVIFRENNAIALSNVIQVSNSRLLLSDVPTMGLMILLTWLVVKWSKQPDTGWKLPLFIGGVLGLLILIRGHPVLLIPFVLFVAVLILRKSRVFIADFLFPFSLGVLSVLVPWFWHNYQITEKFIFQESSSPYMLGDQFVQLYSQEMEEDSEVLGIFAHHVPPGMIRYMIADLPATFRFVFAHYFHNVAQSYIFLPQSLLIEPVERYVVRFPFWSGWSGGLTSSGMTLLPINLGILALGLGSSWKKGRFVALMPLILGVGYNLSVAVSRRSGWRFNLPADWVTIIFFAIGLGQLVLILFSLIQKDRTPYFNVLEYANKQIARTPSLSRVIPLYLTFFITSLGVTQGHRLFSSQFDEVKTTEIPMLTGDFFEQNGASLVQGKVGYPVYFYRNEGILNYESLQYSGKPYERLAFYVISNPSKGVQLRTDIIPLIFPDGANIVVIGCEIDDGYIEALTVLLRTDPPVLYQRDPFYGFHCVIPDP